MRKSVNRVRWKRAGVGSEWWACIWCSKPLTSSFLLGATAILWVPLMDTVMYRLGNASASQGSLASVARGVRPTILDLVLKAANVRGAGNIFFFHLIFHLFVVFLHFNGSACFGLFCYIYPLRNHLSKWVCINRGPGFRLNNENDRLGKEEQKRKRDCFDSVCVLSPIRA